VFEVVGYIQSVLNGNATIVAPLLNRDYLVEHQEIQQVRVIFTDGRTITPRQRAAIYACLGDIAEWTGIGYKYIEELCARFKLEVIRRTGQEYFSLSDTDVSTARLMLSLIIDYCVENGVPCEGKGESLLKRCEDTGRYLYACLIYKKCCICGISGELHHVDAVGSAHRATTVHIGREAMALCRIHHDECHKLGRETFEQRYNVFGVKIDKTIAKVYKL